MSKKPWYNDGLRFECTQCGACCSGEPGVVWINEVETKALAEAFGIEVDEFLRRFARKIGDVYSLIEHPGGDCVFLEPATRQCTVYKDRPIQCRTWPFWDSNLESPRDWRNTCQVCPGAGVGKLYSLSEVTARSSQKSL